MMVNNGTTADPAVSVNSDLARVVDVVTARPRTGAVTADEIFAEFPEYAKQLEQLLPAMALLADVSRSAGQSPEGIGTPRTDDGEPIPGILGDFRIIREVGRGGMGVVYEAEQISLSRRVALKVLPFAATMDPKQLQRFRNEAMAAASLRHEHIVHVYGVGCERAVHFYAMEFIDGLTLSQIIAAHNRPADEPQTPTAGKAAAPTAPIAALSTEPGGIKGREFYRSAARLIADAADALEHAHQLGIVHRDVKPGNRLLDATGKIWVADFGLARFGPEAGLTMSGDLLGTLRYMAPEQALAKHGLVDHRADVYGLGATLYELLTGKPAVGGEDKQEILRRIAFEELVVPRKLDKGIPAELETITLTCLAKEPTERYATAGELAEDLRRWMADQPIRARRPTARQRAARWGRRHPALSAGFGVIVGLLLAGGWIWERQISRAEMAAREVSRQATSLKATGRLFEALAVSQRAAALLPAVGGDKALRQQVTQQVADLTLLNTLEIARLEQTEATADGLHMDAARAIPIYQRAFFDYGVDVFAGNPATLVEALGNQAIREETVAVLDDWSLLTRDQEHRKRLDWLLEAIDHDGVSAIGRKAVTTNNVEALRRVAATIAAEPSRPTVMRTLAHRLRLVGANADAERLLRAGQRAFPDYVWFDIALFQLLMDVKPQRPAEALPFALAAVALRPHLSTCHVNLGGVLRNLGRDPEAKLEYGRAIELQPDCAMAFYNLGLIIGVNGEVAEAVAACRRATELQPNLPSAHFNLGNALRQQGKLEEAETAYRRAVEIQPNYAIGHSNLGNLLREEGKFAEAESACRRAIQLEADYAPAHRHLGWVLCEQRKWAEGEAACRRATQLAPDDAEGHFVLGVVLANRNPAKAEAVYRRAIQLRPDHSQAFFQLGLALCNQGKLAEAEAAGRRAIELSPSDGRAYGSLGYVLYSQRKLAEAESACRRAIQLKPDNELGHITLGLALSNQGKRAEGEAVCRRAIELNPNNVGAYNALSSVLKEQGKLAEATAARRRAVELQPDSYINYSNLGNDLLGEGKFEEAEAAYRRAIQLKPDYATGHLALRNAGRLAALGDKLPLVLSGKSKLVEMADRLALAWFCATDAKKLNVAAARFYAEAFSADSKLADDLAAGHRYNAACAAALAGCGQGSDAAQLDDAEMARLRRQALDWLSADLAAWAKLGEKAEAQPKLRMMEHWREDSDLAGVRDPPALTKLPEAERAAWLKLWSDVNDLLKRPTVPEVGPAPS
jgi:tetratricopeptide (TPR) repeat protein